MRGVGVMLGSVAVHALGIAVLVRFAPRAHHANRAAAAAVPPTVSIEVVPVPEPIAVALLGDEAAPAAAPAPRSTALRTATTGSAAPRRDEVDGGSGAPAGPERSAWMQMRGPDLRGALATVAAPVDDGTVPAAVHHGEVPRVIHDTVTTAVVERDGTIHLHDARDLDIGLSPFAHQLTSLTELRHNLGDVLETWSRDPYAALRTAGAAEPTREQQAVPAPCGSGVDCLPPRPAWAFAAPLGVGKLDVTGWLMRKFVGDPYASRKRALLEQTFDARAERGAADRADQRARSAELAQHNLEQLWATTTDAAARRVALFELWDECDDDEAGARARVMVIGWIRAHLPAGSRDAYSPAELAALSARRTSREPFAPYAP
jgi:hypothetical protein